MNAPLNLTHVSLGEIARAIPGATTVLHKYRLDFCCGGAHTLQEAATKKGVPADQIAAELEQLRQNSRDSPAELDEVALVDHILSQFHAKHRVQLPELIRLATRVEKVHGDHPDCPKGLSAHLGFMAHDLEQHMQKEEQVLFPLIQRGAGRMALMPISIMRHEHNEHGESLENMERLAHYMVAPEGACTTWRALYLGLTQLKQDLMEHIHLENNVLFSRFDGRLGSE